MSATESYFRKGIEILSALPGDSDELVSQVRQACRDVPELAALARRYAGDVSGLVALDARPDQWCGRCGVLLGQWAFERGVEFHGVKLLRIPHVGDVAATPLLALDTDGSLVQTVPVEIQL